MKESKLIKAVKAFNMLKEGKSEQEILEICSYSTFKKVRAVFNKKKENGEELVLERYPQKSKKKISNKQVSTKENLKEKIIESGELKTLDDLIRFSNIDTDEFECTAFTSNVYGSKESPAIQCKGIFKPKIKYPLTLKEQASIFKELVGDYKPNLIKSKKNDFSVNSKYAAVLPIADLHFGSRSITAEIGAENNLKIAKKNLIRSMSFHKEHIIKYDINKVIIPILGDFFNVDNLNSSTTKGTFQEEFTSLKQTFRKGCELMIEVIDSFSSLGQIEVFVCRGNHDEMSSFYLQNFLEAFYKDSDILIDNTDTLRKYTKYGNTCLGFGHGDTKANVDYLSIMLSETDAFSCKYREFLTGHVHHIRSEEKPGIKVRKVGSLCASDTWHKKMGYNSMKSSEGYIVSKDQGIVCNTTFYL